MAADEYGIVPQGPKDDLELANPMDFEDAKCSYFRDGREGEDRWGTPLANKQACGTGWDEEDHVCPLYVEEACPGCKNKGNRVHACYVQSCKVDCGICGGGGEKLSYTMAYCGQKKGAAFHDGALGEFGGSLRLDRYTAPPVLDRARHNFPVNYFPVVEWGGKDWMRHLNAGAAGEWTPEEWEGAYPMIGTTMKSVFPGRGKVGGRKIGRVTPLRERLGGFEGSLLVNGLTKDDLLDDVWHDRKRVMQFCLDCGVDYMLTPQYSAYPEYQNFMMVFNSNRVFTWYTEAMEMGFPNVVLDVPPNMHARWLLDEYFGFIERSQVKIIALSYQQFRSKGAMDPRTVWNAKLIHESIPLDVAVVCFGPSTPQKIMTVSKLFEGRSVVFATAEVYARSAFFELLPMGVKAPAGVKKPEVFCRNVEAMARMTNRSRAAMVKKDSAQTGTRRRSRGRGKAKVRARRKRPSSS